MSPPPQAVALIRWLSAIVVALTISATWELFLGHYRSGFPLKAQYVPLGTAAVLIASGIFGLVLPIRAGSVLEIAGWLGIVTGLIGVGYHHYYGIVEKGGGYRWLLHHIMLHAPPLAPLVLTALGALSLLSGALVNARVRAFGLPVDVAIIAVCAITLVGASLQSGILHYRGAFNNVLMYIPISIPVAAVLALAWQEFAPSTIGFRAAIVMLWLTFLSGFVGFGMHLRGIDRQMGGLYIAGENLMQGPPISAPLTFAGFAGAALAVLYLR